MRYLRLKFSVLAALFIFAQYISAQEQKPLPISGFQIEISDYLSARELYQYVNTLSSEEFEGRLTGHSGYDKSAQWVIKQFNEMGIQGLGENNSYLQKFPHPYTQIFEGSELKFNAGKNSKEYKYIDEFIPGSTSGNGNIKAEVIYLGYGITAPELNYDDYKGLDVKGKIVLFDREVPLMTSHEDFLKWRQYSFHQYKLKNAVKHGAAGMLYNYHIANPNNAYDSSLVYSHVGQSVVNEIFEGTGKIHKELIKQIKNELKPQSFETGKIFTLKNKTLHHPDAIGSNLIAYLEGSDSILKHEYILIGGHLDHLGKCYEIMPGAHDNASGVAVSLGVAKILSESGINLKRSVIFILMGAEEAGLKGVQYFLKNPSIPLENIKAYINMDAVGVGDSFHFGFAKNYPQLYSYILDANEMANCKITGDSTSNISRPRLDAAFFDWYGIPVLSIGSRGNDEAFSNYRYHTPYDNISNINSELMLKLTELLVYTIIDMANDEELNIKRGIVKKEFINE